MAIILGGHRGFSGCTDHPFYQFRDLSSLPVENTVESIEAAFAKGAAFVEIDVVQSADKRLFVLHNVVPSDHFFLGLNVPKHNLNTLAWDQFRDARTGRLGKGRIATLEQALTTICTTAPRDAAYVVNIELKGTQGSGQDRDGPEFVENVARAVAASGIDVSRVLFSSFALQNVIDMAKYLPAAKYGMLFQEGPDPRDIYADSPGRLELQYVPFTMDNVKFVKERFDAALRGRVKLEYLHPEVTTLAPGTLRGLGGQDWKFNVWALFEELDPARLDLYRELCDAARSHDIPLGLITDYIPEMQRAIPELQRAQYA